VRKVDTSRSRFATARRVAAKDSKLNVAFGGVDGEALDLECGRLADAEVDAGVAALTEDGCANTVAVETVWAIDEAGRSFHTHTTITPMCPKRRHLERNQMRSHTITWTHYKLAYTYMHTHTHTHTKAQINTKHNHTHPHH
jgi:hypothetical protein